MKKIILLFCYYFLAGNIFGQSTFIKDVLDVIPGDHTQHNMIEYKGDVIIAGTASPGPVSGTASDIYVQRLDLKGNVIWGKYLYYGQSSFVGGLTYHRESGNIVIVGYRGVPNGLKDMVLIELDANGNLVNDIIIGDSILGYAMYGMDIEYSATTNGYIVVGTGSSTPTNASATKYGFVIGLRKDFNILWQKRYLNNNLGVTPTNESINEILRIPADTNPIGDELFFVRGIRTRDNNNLQANINLLFDANGNQLWQSNTSLYAQTFGGGGIALYSRTRKAIYTAQTVVEGQIEITSYDIVNGQTLNSKWLFIDYDYPTNLVTGMQWNNEKEEELVLHSFLIEDDHEEVKSCLINMNLNNNDYWVNVYAPVTNLAGYAAVNFDFIVKPIEGNGRFYGQAYYQPKSMIRDEESGHFIFTGLRFGKTSPIHLMFYNTNNNGIVEGPECYFETELTITENQLPHIGNLSPNLTPFTTIGQGTNELIRPSKINLYCGEDTPPVYPKATRIQKNQSQGYNQIEMYPNPAQNSLTIRGVEQGKVYIYNVQGQQVKTVTLENGYEVMNIANLQSGMYFVKVANQQGILYTVKLIKE